MIKYLWILFISMLPIVELRGAIPYSQVMGLPVLNSYLVAVIGNIIPIPFVYFFGKKIIEMGKKYKLTEKFSNYVYEKGKRAGDKLTAKASNKGIFLAIMLFVGIPFPATGVYTGVLASSLLDIDFKTTVFASICGVILSGLITAFLSFNIVRIF